MIGRENQNEEQVELLSISHNALVLKQIDDGRYENLFPFLRHRPQRKIMPDDNNQNAPGSGTAFILSTFRDNPPRLSASGLISSIEKPIIPSSLIVNVDGLAFAKAVAGSGYTKGAAA